MKTSMNLEEHTAMKEKIMKKMKTKDRQSEVNEMDLIVNKETKKPSKNKSSEFRNNYKNYQYDYEEDFYVPRY